MDYNNVLVILIIITFGISGYYINFIRKIPKTDLVKVADDNSLIIFRLLIPLAIFVSSVFYFFAIGTMSLPYSVVLMGYALVVFGLLFRWIAVSSLGTSFRVRVSLVKNQKLQTDGVYKYIRHPSYTGSLVYYFGLAIVMQNYYAVLLLLVAPFYVVINRVLFEEKFLIDAFGESYVKYQNKTKKIIPFIY